MLKLTSLAVLVLGLFGCATGQSQRTTVTAPTGERTVYEARQTGLWFTSGRIDPLMAASDPLEINDKK